MTKQEPAEPTNFPVVVRNFLALINHEIRTPLHIIFGMEEALLETQLTEAQRKYVCRIRRETEHLHLLFERILTYSSLSADQTDAVEESLEQFLVDVLEYLETQCQKKGLAFHYSIDPLLPKKLKNLKQVSQILFLLVDNAVKFTERGEIALRIQREIHDRSIRFILVDTGPGIPKEVYPRLFQPFVQLEDCMTRKHSGLGLGLSIAKKMVDLLGGDIGVMSLPGKGSTFWFTIPI